MLWGAAFPQHQGDCRADSLAMVNISVETKNSFTLPYIIQFSWMINIHLTWAFQEEHFCCHCQGWRWGLHDHLKGSFSTNRNSFYNWIADQRYAHEKSIFRQTRGVTTISRQSLESSRQGKFRSAGSIFLWSFFDLLIFKTSENVAPTKINQSDSDSPRGIL